MANQNVKAKPEETKTEKIKVKEVKKVSEKEVKQTKPTIKTIFLPEEVFGVKVNTQAVFDVIMSERASRRQGTHKVKTRGEVSGGGRKPWRQKGTGNARQGSIRSPQWVGGGVAWGPNTEKNYTLKVNKKIRDLAFTSALTLKAKDNAIIVHDFKSGDKPNTKDLLKHIESLKLKKEYKKVVIITDNDIVWKSASNLAKTFATKLSALTIETIVNADVMIFEKEPMKRLWGNK